LLPLAVVVVMVMPGGIANSVSHIDHKTCMESSGGCSGVRAVINARRLCNKTDEFRLCLYDHNIDACCVTETWLN